MGNTNHNKRNEKQHSRYIVIAKVGNSGGKAVCVKYRCKDLQKFVLFLDDKYKKWTWFNVYSNVGSNKGAQLASFTKNNLPRYPHV